MEERSFLRLIFGFLGKELTELEGGERKEEIGLFFIESNRNS